MAILEKEVEVSINEKNYWHFENKGFNVFRYTDRSGKIRVKREKFKIPVVNVPVESRALVTKICDNCGSHLKQAFCEVMKNREKSKDKDLCRSCHQRESNKKSRNIAYEKSSEYFCKINDMDFLIGLFSVKNEKTMRNISRGSGEKFLWNCGDYGELHEHEYRINEKLKNPNSCPFCSGKKVNETNCLKTTHPHIADILWNPEEALVHTFGSGFRLDFKCPDCNTKIKQKQICNIVNSGTVFCPNCSDGVSYPEKLLYQVLKQSNINFEWQRIFEWSKNKRYDFFLPKLECIVEIHGRQHYDQFSSFQRRSLNEEQENDNLKERMATHNGVKKYIVINAAESDLKYIQYNIMESELSRIIDLNDINWKLCHENACKSLVKITCDMWNSGMENTKEIARHIGLAKQTVIRYLKQGSMAGLTTYDLKKIKREKAQLATNHIMKKVIKLTTDCDFLDEYESINEAARHVGVHNTTIGKALSKISNNKTAGGYKWMYKEDYDKYIEEKNNNVIHIG